MRKILYRAWLKDEERMVEVKCIDFNGKQIGYLSTLCLVEDDEFITDDVTELDYALFDRIELMQFTGLLDSKGNKIFEGDIIKTCKYAWEWNKKNWNIEIGVIRFENGCFKLDDICSSDGYNELSCVYGEFAHDNENNIYEEDCIFEVIGNIYENPKLLEGRK